MRVLLLIALTWFFQFQLICQESYMLTGHVIDESHSPLPGATIIINSGELSTVTNKQGEFIFNGLSKQEYLLEISFLGYEIYNLTVNPSRVYNFEIV